MSSAPDIAAFYELLRALNEHLPPGELVDASSPLAIELQPGRLPVLNLQVYITLPDVAIGSEKFTVYDDAVTGRADAVAGEADAEGVPPEEHRGNPPEEKG